MPSYSLKIDYASIKRKLDVAISNSPAVRRVAWKHAFGIFSAAKRTMLREFDRHDVTAELKAGPRGLNISDTLEGYGNLFSFIGFPSGDDPTEGLRQLLEEGTELRQTVYRNGAWYFRASLPSKEAIEGVTQMPWESGNSWAYAVETYISGLSHYLYKKWAGSRSGMGVQLPYEHLEDIVFQPHPYITEILRNFRERINGES